MSFDQAKQSATDAFKTVSKRAIQKTEATADLIRNKSADKIPQRSVPQVFQIKTEDIKIDVPAQK